MEREDNFVCPDDRPVYVKLDAPRTADHLANRRVEI
jgi:hypothetical protein